MGNLCQPHPLQTRVVFYLIRVLLKALDLADNVDVIFCCIPVAGHSHSARVRHHVAITAHSDES